MNSLLFSSCTVSPTQTSVNYIALSGRINAAQNTENNKKCIMPTSGTFSGLRVSISAPAGAGKSWTIVLRKNGADTALTCVISGDTDTIGTDLANSVSFVAGDLINYEITPSGTPTAMYPSFCINFSSDTAGESIQIQNTGSVYIGSTTNYYLVPFGSPSPALMSTESSTQMICPINCTIKNLYISMLTSPGASKDRTFTLRVNGVSTSLSVTVSGTTTSGNDTSNEVSVSAGDLISLLHTSTGTPSDTAQFKHSFSIISTAGNEFFTTSRFVGSATAINYTGLSNTNQVAAAASMVAPNISSAMTVSKVYAYITTACGASKSRTFMLQSNSADTNLSVTIAGTTDISANYAENVSISDSDILRIKHTPSGTPASSANQRFGLACYIDSNGSSLSGTLSETFSFSDSIDVRAVSKVMPDSLSFTDSIAVRTVSKVVAETFLLSDNVAIPGNAYTDTKAETFNLAEAVKQSPDKAMSDGFSLSEATTKSASRKQSDAFTLTDGKTQSANMSRSDSMSLAESKNLNPNIKNADTLSLNEAVRTGISGAKSETFSLTESVSKNSVVYKVDIFSLIDAKAQSINVAKGDAFSLTETNRQSPNKAFSESFSLTENNTKQIGKKQADSFNLADGKYQAVNKSLAENYSLLDSLRSTIAKSLIENFSLADFKSGSLSKLIADVFSMADNVSGLISIALSKNESFTLTDLILSKNAESKKAETFNLIDSKIQTTSKKLTENFAFSDSIRKSAGKYLSEIYSLTEQIGLGISRGINENFDLLDSVKSNVSKRIAENFILTESFANSIQMLKSDVLHFADGIGLSGSKNLSENFNFLENLQTVVDILRSDNFGITDENIGDILTINLFDVLLLVSD